MKINYFIKPFSVQENFEGSSNLKNFIQKVNNLARQWTMGS